MYNIIINKCEYVYFYIYPAFDNDTLEGGKWGCIREVDMAAQVKSCQLKEIIRLLF